MTTIKLFSIVIGCGLLIINVPKVAHAEGTENSFIEADKTIAVNFQETDLDIGEAVELKIDGENNDLEFQADQVKVIHGRTASEIAKVARGLQHHGFNRNHKTAFTTTPRLTSPYNAGVVKQSDIDDALKALKMVRFLAGVPYSNTKFTAELNNYAQHGAVLINVGEFSHHPPKPSDMSDIFYNTAYKGTSEANLYIGPYNLAEFIIGWVEDPGSNNLGAAGHRRWMIRPDGEKFGIGYTRNKSGSGYSSLHVFQGGLSTPDSYVAWPNAGDFPIEYFVAHNLRYSGKSYVDIPWSINLGINYVTPNKDQIKLSVTRQRDGKVWVFDKNTPNLNGVSQLSGSTLHLAVDDMGYGMRKAIVFRPDPNSLGLIQDNDTFNIKLEGIERWTDPNCTYDYIGSGCAKTATTLEYQTRFFNLEEELKKVTPQKTGNSKYLYRFWSEKFRGHFYTADYNEAQKLAKNDPNWRYEGEAYEVYQKNVDGEMVPVYRFWSANYKAHFYTTSEEEKKKLEETDKNWRYEHVAFYVYPNNYTGKAENGKNTRPVYRFWSKDYNHHFFTASETEKAKTDADQHWRYERIAWRVSK